MPSHGDFARYCHRGNRRRPKGRRRSHGPQPYKVMDFIGAYLLALTAFLVSAAISPVLAVFAYVLSGIYLSRFIGDRVDWWIIMASVKNVAAVKLHSIFTWPVSVPVFIFQVIIVKFL